MRDTPPEWPRAEQPMPLPRRSPRITLNAEVYLRRSAKMAYRVTVLDISQHGCRLEFVERPELQERVWIKFDRLEALESGVCWIDGFVAGLEFSFPIHPAVFDLLVARLKGPA